MEGKKYLVPIVLVVAIILIALAFVKPGFLEGRFSNDALIIEPESYSEQAEKLLNSDEKVLKKRPE